jgi:hypothetical protein
MVMEECGKEEERVRAVERPITPAPRIVKEGGEDILYRREVGIDVGSERLRDWRTERG